jgi:hypothetical protein
MTAVVNVTEWEDVELGDVSIEPLHQQPIEFSWHNLSGNLRKIARLSRTMETLTGADLYEVVQGKRPCSMF